MRTFRSLAQLIVFVAIAALCPARAEARALQPAPFMASVVLAQSDLPALARAQLRAIQTQSRVAAGAATNAVIKAHWSDISDRVSEILETRKWSAGPQVLGGR